MVRIFLIFFFSAILVMPLSAQQTQEQLDEVIELNQLDLLDSGGIIGSEQSNGNVNGTTLINARNFDFPSNEIPAMGNVASIYQIGDNNNASFLQTGNRNNFGLLQQGNSNNYQGILTGEENLIRVFQIGNNHTLSHDLSGDEMNMEFIQEGQNHDLTIIEKSGTAPDYIIHQQGNSGMKVVIENEKIWE